MMSELMFRDAIKESKRDFNSQTKDERRVACDLDRRNFQKEITTPIENESKGLFYKKEKRYEGSEIKVLTLLTYDSREDMLVEKKRIKNFLKISEKVIVKGVGT